MEYKVEVPDELNKILIEIADNEGLPYEKYVQNIVNNFLEPQYRRRYKDIVQKLPVEELAKIDLSATSVASEVIIKPIK